jgi:hypothetical protein
LQALDITRRVGDDSGRVAVLNNLAGLYKSTGE